jgi:hypothetical protein
MFKLLRQIWRDWQDQRRRDIELEKMPQQELKWVHEQEQKKRAALRS